MNTIKEAFVTFSDNEGRLLNQQECFKAGYLAGLKAAAKECNELDAQHKDTCAYHCEESIRQLAKGLK